jgi:hypothetical protein
LQSHDTWSAKHSRNLIIETEAKGMKINEKAQTADGCGRPQPIFLYWPGVHRHIEIATSADDHCGEPLYRAALENPRSFCVKTVASGWPSTINQTSLKLAGIFVRHLSLAPILRALGLRIRAIIEQTDGLRLDVDCKSILSYP